MEIAAGGRMRGAVCFESGLGVVEATMLSFALLQHRCAAGLRGTLLTSRRQGGRLHNEGFQMRSDNQVLRLTSYVEVMALFVMLIGACTTPQDRKQEQQAAAASAAAAALQLQQAQQAAEKARLRSQPDLFLQTSNLTYYDKGIINDYRQLTGVTVLNKSKYPVNNLQGEVDWIGSNGAKAGSVPFTLSGSIPAGDTKTFSSAAGTLSNGTLETSASRAAIRFTHVDVVESP
jgi:hypothetical protein